MPTSGKPPSGMKTSLSRPDSFFPVPNSSGSDSLHRPLVSSLMPSAATSGCELSKDRLIQLLSAVEDEYDKVAKENARLKSQIESMTRSNFYYSDEVATSSGTNQAPSRLIGNSSKFAQVVPSDETHSPPQLSSVDNSLQKLKLLKGGEQLQRFTTNSRRKIVSATSRLRNIPTADAQIVRVYVKHSDGIWDVAAPKASLCPYTVLGSASADRTACIWNARTGQHLTQYQGHDGSVNSVRFQPVRVSVGDSILVLTASGDQTAHVWKVSPVQLAEREADDERMLAPVPDGDHSSSAPHPSAKSTKILVNYPLMVLRSHSSSVSCAEWLSADQVVTASWDRTAMVFDVETGDNLNTFAGHDDELTFVAVSRAQKIFVTSSKDTTFRLWDLREPNLQSVSVFQGHTEAVNCAVFSPGGESIVSGGDDKWLRVWDLRNMRSPKSSVRLDDGINRIAISESNMVAAPLDKRSVGIYSISTGKLARLPRAKRGQGHQRMVTSCAWWDEALNNSPTSGMDINLFTCGFDRIAIGWKVSPV